MAEERIRASLVDGSRREEKGAGLGLHNHERHVGHVSRRAALSALGHQAHLVLCTGVTVAPVLFGLDKFANLLVERAACLAPWTDGIVPGSTTRWG